MTRREWIATSGAAVVAPRATQAAAPSAPVAVAKCGSYGSELLPTMQKMVDGVGGLGKLVGGKTVTIKINMTGSGAERLGYTPAELAHWTHPNVIAATVHLLSRAGARRIRICESGFQTTHPIPELMYEANWDPEQITGAGKGVEFENTNWLGSYKQYARFKPAKGGLLFPEYWLNAAYEQCDVFVTIAKIKEHATAGITLGMKNLFGMTPCTIYGDSADANEPSPLPKGGRGSVFHSGRRQPSKISAPELYPNASRDDKYRIPRAVADLASARPIHLTVLEGIATMAGGEGPWIRNSVPVKPGLLVIGTNPVCTDAVATACMGFDPMADRGTAPFETCDSTLKLAEELGIGTRDLQQIEVVGTPIANARFEFRKHRAANARVRG